MEQALQILTELIVSHDERLVKSLNNDEDLNAKISALVDAQIRSEDKLQGISENLNAKISALVDAQIRSEDKLQGISENLNAKISTLVDAQFRSEDNLQGINAALEKLTHLVEKAHLRIDRLES